MSQCCYLVSKVHNLSVFITVYGWEKMWCFYASFQDSIECLSSACLNLQFFQTTFKNWSKNVPKIEFLYKSLQLTNFIRFLGLGFLGQSVLNFLCLVLNFMECKLLFPLSCHQHLETRKLLKTTFLQLYLLYLNYDKNVCQ